MAGSRSEGEASTAPARQGLVLAALILVAAVANLNLAVANVALPDIGKAFDASQTALDLIAVGYSLGLASSVLYLGALGDRYGRKLMLVLGTFLAIPASILAATASSVGVLIGARIVGGLAAGMAYPTTLALITALWSGPGRTRSIALWSGLGGAISALGPLLSGALLEHHAWGSVFLLTLPLAVVALVMAILLVPSHVNETSDPVDNLGGILSVVAVAAIVLAINFAPVPNKGTVALGLAVVALAALAASTCASGARGSRCMTLHVAARRDLLGRGARGDHRVRQPDGRDVRRPAVPAERARLLDARRGPPILPAAVFMVAIAPRSAKLVDARGAQVHAARRLLLLPARFPHDAAALEVGHPLLEGGTRLRLRRGRRGLRRHPRLALPDRVSSGQTRGHGVGDRRPAARPRRRDHAVDHGRAAHRGLRDRRLEGDRGSAEQSADHDQRRKRADEVVLERRVGRHISTRTTRARSRRRPGPRSCPGADWSYAAGIIAIVLGAGLIFFLFPGKDDEQRLLVEYHAQDTAGAAADGAVVAR